MSAAEYPPGALGKPIRGPSALGGSPHRFFHLVRTLAVLDFKLRFFGSALGYFWQVMRPLMLFAVLYVVFTEFVQLGDGVNFYPVLLLMGIVLFTFFADVTGDCVTSVVDRESLVRKIQFPRLVIPLAVLLRAYFNLALNLLVVLGFALALGVDPHLSWFQVPFLLLALGVFAAGVGMIVSAAFVRYRDIKPIWEVVLQMLFYGTPILYVVELVPREGLKELLMISPLGAIVEQMRHAFVDPTAPSAAEAAGGYVMLLIPAGIVAFLFLFGFWYFNRAAPRIAEEL
ncbi:MAG: ABC transporter permease [Thermoleophilaceae bacterium]|nr:ABC transporter permease [Thermoleophilaceae bacterium]